MSSGESLPQNVHSMNAYLGYVCFCSEQLYIQDFNLFVQINFTAVCVCSVFCKHIVMFLRGFPIAEALSLGADVVVTGRCVDSALTLGPLIHQVRRTASHTHTHSILSSCMTTVLYIL